MASRAKKKNFQSRLKPEDRSGINIIECGLAFFTLGTISSANLHAPIITIGLEKLDRQEGDKTGTNVFGANVLCRIGLSSK